MGTRMIRTAGCMVATLLLVGSYSLADTRLCDDTNGMLGWRGTTYLSAPMPGLFEVLAVDVDYCVYAPGDFNLSFSGLDPSGGAHYEYAYQIFNNLDPHPSAGTGYGPDYVSRMSIDLDQDESATNCSYLLDTGIAPSGVDTLTPGSTQVGWDFTAMAYSTSPPAVSAILLFTSPGDPEPDMDKAQVTGWQDAKGRLPSPRTVPEPATMSLLAIGLAGLLRQRRSYSL